MEYDHYNIYVRLVIVRNHTFAGTKYTEYGGIHYGHQVYFQ